MFPFPLRPFQACPRARFRRRRMSPRTVRVLILLLSAAVLTGLLFLFPRWLLVLLLVLALAAIAWLLCTW